MATRRTSSLFLVLLLASALLVPISSIMIPSGSANNLNVTLTLNHGKSGDVIIVTATNAAQLVGTVCTITDNSPAHNVVTSATASVSAANLVSGSFIVGNAPAAAGAGTYTISVKCPSSGTDNGQATFLVDPRIFVSPPIGMRGQVVQVTGVGFRTEATGCTIGASAGGLFAATPPCSINPSGSPGTVSGQFTVSSTAAVTLYDITVNPIGAFPAATEINGFQVVTGPTITLSPTSVPPGYGTRKPDGTLGGAVSISGGGFATSASARSCTLSLTAGSGLFAPDPATACSISSTGTVTGSFAVAQTAPLFAAYIVRVTDTNPAGAFADSPAFTVSAAAILNAAVPINGPPGTVVALTTSTSFPVQDVGPCLITSNPTGLISVPTCFINAFGNLPGGAASFIASGAGGAYTVTVTGLHGDSASTAFTVTPQITLNPSSGSPPVSGSPGAAATEVTVTGSGFKPSGACTVTAAALTMIVDTSGEPACSVSSTGVLSANLKFKVGAGSAFTALGYTIRTTGPQGDFAEATFMVLPQITLSPSSGAPGVTVSVLGAGFKAAGGGCGLTAPSAGAACTQAADGTISGTFNVAAVPPGFYFVIITDVGGAPPTASKTFTVTGGPIVTFSQNIGPTGTTVTVTGSGWNSLDTSVSFTESSGPAGGLFTVPDPKTCTVSGGSISSCSFQVKSNALGGTYTLTFTGSQGDKANGQFQVISTLFLTPDNGGRGTTVALSGSGYTAAIPNCAPALSFNPNEPFTVGAVTCIVDATGLLTGSIKVANGVNPGPHTVTLTDSRVVQGAVSATFTVITPTISLSPSSGSGGDTIHVSGSGFSSADVGCTIAAPANVIEGTPTCSMSDGVVTGSFIIKGPNNPAAVLTNAIQVTGTVGDSAVNTLTVVPKITLTPNTSVSVGTVITISGTNFVKVAGCTTTSSPPPNPSVGTCNIDTDLTVKTGSSFTVPATWSGPYTITVTDTQPVSASASITVVPREVTLTPSFGPQGTVVTVTGSGFSPTDTGCAGATLVSNPPGVPTATTCSITNGVLSGSFTVASGAGILAQSYAIIVTGNILSDTGSADFLVTPSLTIAPTSGRPGTLVTVFGGNWPGGDNGPCTITSDPSGLISSPVCNIAGGAVAGAFTVASGTSGPYTVIVTGAAGTQAFADFNAPLAPTLTLTPPAGPGGQLVTVSGLNYQGSTCLLTSVPGGLFNTVSCAISGGTLTGSFTVATSASPGTAYTVTATTNIGTSDSASQTFTVTAGPLGTLTLTPIQGQVGTIVSGSATGFTSDTTCQLTATPAVILSSASCSITGAGNANVGFTVAPNTPAGSYNILVVGNTGKSASSSFTVLAGAQTAFTLDPVSGPVGTVVSISGSTYAGTTCTLSVTPSNLFSSSSCTIASGSLSGGFTVATGASLGYTVTLNTNAGESKTAPFTVTTGPAPTLNPTSGSPGSTVQVSGSGYHGTTCTLTSIPAGLFSSSSCSITNGALLGSYTIATGASGNYMVILTTDVGETAASLFAVRYSTTFTMSPTSGNAGNSVSVSGLNYQGNSCTLSSSPSNLIGSSSCSISGGTLSGGFTVASGAGGSYTVTVTTNAGETNSATFNVIVGPTFSLSPQSGTTGTAVSASGSNYAGTSCTISASGLFSSSSCAISAGKLTGGFTVAITASAGSYTVTVTTNAGETNSAGFTVNQKTTPYCIIATVTFGSEASPAVQLLRGFRDNLVLKTTSGSAFMQVFNAWYYSFSPSVAKFIEFNDPLRAPIRVLLYPLLGILGVSAFTYSLFSASPEFAVVIAGLVASSLIGLVYLTPFTLVSMRALTRRKRINTNSIAKASLLVLSVALGLLAAGELANSFLMLAVASSAIVLTCIIAAPTIVALLVLRPKSQ